MLVGTKPSISSHSLKQDFFTKRQPLPSIGNNQVSVGEPGQKRTFLNHLSRIGELPFYRMRRERERESSFL